jgi:large subunit ribosomal protein L15
VLDRLEPRPGARKRPKRVGRGNGSGVGRYCGRGVKGQGTRSQGKGAHFEGGQMPLARRIPKRGFTNVFRKPVRVLNLSDLASLGDGATVDAETLVRRGLVRTGGAPIKLLGEGEAPKNLTVKLHRISSGARQKVEAAGGSVELLA